MEAYLAGMLVGDGCKQKRKNGAFAVWVDQHNRNNEILQKISKILTNKGFKIFEYSVPANKRRVLVYSKVLFNEFVEISKNSAKFFIELDVQEKKNFIGGFFDAEGTVTDRLVIYNSNKSLLEAIKIFLITRGIVCYIYRFGKVFGLQIYQKKSVEIFKEEIKCVKMSHLSG